MEVASYFDEGIEIAKKYGPNLILALAMLVGGLWVIKRVSATFAHVLKTRNVDTSLRPFFSSMLDVAMKIFLLLVVAGKLGFETTSFIAIFSALAFAIGLALQGSLGNFASGILILLFRPYKVGDQITVVEKSGRVDEIQIFNTILMTPAGKRIIIPNGKMSEGPIENIHLGDEVRSDVKIDVKDDTSINLLRAVVGEVVNKCPFRVAGKDAFVEIEGFPRDAMTVTIGCWTVGEKYSDTFYYLNEELKKAFDAVGIVLAKEGLEE